MGESDEVIAIFKLLTPCIVFFTIWALLFLKELTRGQLSIRSILVATTFVAIYISFIQLTLWLSR